MIDIWWIPCAYFGQFLNFNMAAKIAARFTENCKHSNVSNVSHLTPSYGEDFLKKFGIPP